MKKLRLLFFTLFIFTSSMYAQDITHKNVNFTIREIPTPAVKAFYIGRGFSIEQIQPYADSCVYTTTMRNDNTNESIHYLRKSWFASSDGKKIPVHSNDYWHKKFIKTGMTPSSWIAFRLSQMPEEQEYGANGGWNQGIFSVDVAHGSNFDLTIVWDIKGEKHELTVPNITCSK